MRGVIEEGGTVLAQGMAGSRTLELAGLGLNLTDQGDLE